MSLVYQKDIVWEDVTNGSITTRFGRIEDELMFTMTRFNTPAFPDENWLVTSNVIPMEMMKGKDLRRLEADVNLALDTFLLKIMDI